MELDSLLEAILFYRTLLFAGSQPQEQVRVLTQCYMLNDELLSTGVIEPLGSRFQT